MEKTNQSENPANPAPCKSGCGFYGSSATNDLCSKCFKDTCNITAAAAAVSSPAPLSSCQKAISLSSSLSSNIASSTKPVLASSIIGSRIESATSKLASTVFTESSSPLKALPSSHNNTLPISTPSSDGKQKEFLDSVSTTTLSLSSLDDSLSYTENNLSLTSSLQTIDSISPIYTNSPITPAKANSSQSSDIFLNDANTQKDLKDSSKKTTRCLLCKKKTGLTGFSCRCGGLFCCEHRYSDRHNCTFNYKKLGEKELRRNNPQINAQKLHKI